MKDELKEQLSALVDDELRRDEAAFLSRRLGRDGEALDQLGRYFLISDCLRNQLPETVNINLSERVAAALENEAEFHASSSSLMRRLARPLAGLGVAASVAMVGVTLWSGDSGSPTSDARFVAAQSNVNPAPQQSLAQPIALSPDADGGWERLDPEAQRRLNVYLVNHSEHSSTGRFGGVLNYVRIAGQQERE